jgi:hypothetical protein
LKPVRRWYIPIGSSRSPNRQTGHTRRPHSRRNIREVLRQSEPTPYRLSQPRPRKVLTETCQRWTDAVLAADEQAPPKQRHLTAALLDRLTHHCEIFEMNGESYRFRESMK